MAGNNSCSWFEQNQLLLDYHNTEWGLPVHDDRKLYEYLFMEAMSTGLSWQLMLKKRDVFRRCFAGFDFNVVAKFDEKDVGNIFSLEGMIRSRNKIKAMINNANCFVRIVSESGSFNHYIWSFTNFKTLVYLSHQHRTTTKNKLSDQISKDLRKHGFKYLGTVTTYSYLQAIGIINDHSINCPRWRDLTSNTHPDKLQIIREED